MALENLLGGLATDAKLEVLRVLLAGTLKTSGLSAVAATSNALTGIADATGYTPTGGVKVTDGAPNLVIGPFAPQLARDIWVTLKGTAASGSAQLQRSTDGGTNKIGLTAGGKAWGLWSFSAVTGPIVNESIVIETDAAATYYLAVTLTAGSITYRVAQ